MKAKKTRRWDGLLASNSLPENGLSQGGSPEGMQIMDEPARRQREHRQRDRAALDRDKIRIR